MYNFLQSYANSNGQDYRELRNIYLQSSGIERQEFIAQVGGEIDPVLAAYSQISGIPLEEIVSQLEQVSPEEQQAIYQQMAQAVQQSQNQGQQQDPGMMQYGGIPVTEEGYRELNPIEDPYAMIPSGDISMEGIPYPINAYDGNSGQFMETMQPGQRYRFPTNSVLEQPLLEGIQQTGPNYWGGVRDFFLDPYSYQRRQFNRAANAQSNRARLGNDLDALNPFTSTNDRGLGETLTSTLSIPSKLTNQVVHGKYTTTPELLRERYGQDFTKGRGLETAIVDFATDPMSYVGATEIKKAGELAVKHAPALGKAAVTLALAAAKSTTAAAKIVHAASLKYGTQAYQWGKAALKNAEWTKVYDVASRLKSVGTRAMFPEDGNSTDSISNKESAAAEKDPGYLLYLSESAKADDKLQKQRSDLEKETINKVAKRAPHLTSRELSSIVTGAFSQAAPAIYNPPTGTGALPSFQDTMRNSSTFGKNGVGAQFTEGLKGKNPSGVSDIKTPKPVAKGTISVGKTSSSLSGNDTYSDILNTLQDPNFSFQPNDVDVLKKRVQNSKLPLNQKEILLDYANNPEAYLEDPRKLAGLDLEPLDSKKIENNYRPFPVSEEVSRAPGSIDLGSLGQRNIPEDLNNASNSANKVLARFNQGLGLFGNIVRNNRFANAFQPAAPAFRGQAEYFHTDAPLIDLAPIQDTFRASINDLTRGINTNSTTGVAALSALSANAMDQYGKVALDVNSKNQQIEAQNRANRLQALASQRNQQTEYDRRAYEETLQNASARRAGIDMATNDMLAAEQEATNKREMLDLIPLRQPTISEGSRSLFDRFLGRRNFIQNPNMQISYGSEQSPASTTSPDDMDTRLKELNIQKRELEIERERQRLLSGKLNQRSR